jgi:hypothetical protein
MLNRDLAIERLLLEGGGSNGALPRAGLIDEISLADLPRRRLGERGAEHSTPATGMPRIGTDHLDDAGEHRGAGGRRGLAPLSAPKPVMHGGGRR